MSLLREQVLVLNRNWVADHVTDVEQALTDMYRGAVQAVLVPRSPLDIEPMHTMTWAEWLAQPLKPGDKVIRTPRYTVRVPTVVSITTYDRVRKVRPKLNNAAIGKRDRYICQVSGQFAPPGVGNVDHRHPKGRGGAKKSWTNMVWMRKDLNTLKGNRTIEEMGWKLLREPKAPLVMPAAVIEAPENRPEWKRFLITHQ